MFKTHETIFGQNVENCIQKEQKLLSLPVAKNGKDQEIR